MSKEQLNKVTHSVRASQAVLQYGVGAMVDFPDQTLMTAAHDNWESAVYKIHDERLEKRLKVDYFGMPGNGNPDGVSYTRFPEWYFCPKCRRFQPIKEWLKEYRTLEVCKKIRDKDPHMIRHMKCFKCHQELVVSRIVVVCDKGHIDDFPWIQWAHVKSGYKICDKPLLRFTSNSSSSSGLEGLSVSCECGARATLAGAFNRDSLGQLNEKTGGEYKFGCTGRHPWKNVFENCTSTTTVLQRGASTVYFPIIESSLVIPPYSSKLTAKIQESKSFDSCKEAVRASMQSFKSIGMTLSQDMYQKIIDSSINEYSVKIAKEIGISEEKVRPILVRKWNDEENNTTEKLNYKIEEYLALSGEAILNEKDGEFVREETDIAEYKLQYISRISLIHKIREVQALIGFSRLKPIDSDAELGDKQPNIVGIKTEDVNWLPGYEVRGEGIFIEFDNDQINNWRNNNLWAISRAEELNKNYKNSYFGSISKFEVSVKYMFLHTISHLLIKQLSFECGYSIASLKEKIYCSEAADGKEMAGILIYTASGDSEGTLGGLVRQGYADTFPEIFNKAINSAKMCSNDPVCSLSRGQGRDSLNMAACYSCCLIPETSCEKYNSFLDRGLLIGTYKDRDNGAFCNKFIPIQARNNVKTSPNIKVNVEKLELHISGGMDYSSESYETIWNNQLEGTFNQDEIKLFAKLKEKSQLFENKEKPIAGPDIMVLSENSVKTADLVWENSRVMLFGEDYREEYEKLKNSEWKCLFAPEINEWKTILELLEDK